jgi:hypothetical protein
MKAGIQISRPGVSYVTLSEAQAMVFSVSFGCVISQILTGEIPFEE